MITTPEMIEAAKRAYRETANYSIVPGNHDDGLSAALTAALPFLPGDPVGEAGGMPGSNGGFTMAAFKASDVPIGTKLYAAPAPQPVSVKALEWTKSGPNGIIADHGFYSIYDLDGDGHRIRGRFMGRDTYQWFGSFNEAKAAAQADYESRIRSALSTSPSDPVPTTSSRATYTQAECDEMCEIAERDGYEKAVQDIDQLTGGDGEYRVSMLIGGGIDEERHTPDAPSMIQRIVDRFETLDLLRDAEKSGRDQEWGLSQDHAAEIEALRVENAALRKIISDCAASLPNGAFIDTACSVEFMQGLPKEISLVCAALQQQEEGK